MMINDPDHAVRMHMAKVVTSLHCAAGGDELVSQEEQLQTFEQVLDVLKKADVISVSLHHKTELVLLCLRSVFVSSLLRYPYFMVSSIRGSTVCIQHVMICFSAMRGCPQSGR